MKDPSAEDVAVGYLKSGSVIAVPTDTVYGLACDATNVSAINKLYSIKNRNKNKPLAICLNQVSELELWAEVHHLSSKILHALLPGPYTLVLKSTNNLDASLILKGNIGIRIPDYPFIRHISGHLGKPIALTSANLSNEPSATEILEFKSIWDQIPVIFDGAVIFDGGKLSNDRASTVVDLTEPGLFKVIRKGAGYLTMLNIFKEFGLEMIES
ncbi:unnamed protein product [Acanthoscelides obtectus]|uniref:Threonylcarbamoyl-AMP synthase n=1 Tax=Acanthoscelides obtectus TaxID=200917 RepID=A0A9P0PCW5_ACAOB|nr:unnamed protein product [Acanthoscelides obtectus]CAK1628253.1 YrdC domain-containing protein, mitochondrial [Acanthoscelides obtectus]